MKRKVGSGLLAACLAATALAAGPAAAAQSDKARIAALEAKVQRLDDIEAINKLTRAYGYYIDKQIWPEVISLFADDAVVEISGRGVYRNKAGVQRLFHDVLGKGQDGLAANTLSNHLVLQGIVDVDPGGRTAKGRWRAFISVGVYQKTALWAEGPYEMTYVKDKGVWKFQTMHWYGTYFTPFDQGWAKQAFGNNAPSKDVPPDAPPSVVYDAYPGHYVPPFHYPNPVTGRPWTAADTDKYSTKGQDPGRAANAGQGPQPN